MTEATDKFNAMMADRAGVVMPINADIDVITDAMGKELAMIDPFGQLSLDQRAAFGAMIVLAVNTCGSFRATLDQGLDQGLADLTRIASP